MCELLIISCYSMIDTNIYLQTIHYILWKKKKNSAYTYLHTTGLLKITLYICIRRKGKKKVVQSTSSKSKRKRLSESYKSTLHCKLSVQTAVTSRHDHSSLLDNKQGIAPQKPLLPLCTLQKCVADNRWDQPRCKIKLLFFFFLNIVCN